MFLRNIFAHWGEVLSSARQDELRFELADRLIKLDFEDTAIPVLAQATPPSDEDLLLMGQAALASYDAAAALTHLKSISGPEVEVLRAKALALIGEHGAAQIAYSKASEPQDALREAWRDGDWDFVRENAEGTERAFVETFATNSSEPAVQSGPGGPLNRAEALIDTSEKERKIFREILGKFASPSAESTRKPDPVDNVTTN
jgi:hypothetical protein